MLRDSAQAVLVISVDDYDENNPLDWFGKALEVISSDAIGLSAEDPITEEERESIGARVDALKYSDIANPAKRIAIPITDGVIPIHQTSYQAHHNLGVSNQEVSTVTTTGKPNTPGASPQYDIKSVFRPGSNQIQLQFEMRNNLRKLSTIADIIAQQSESMASRTVKVAYFSATMCVFSSTLIGVNRSAVQGTDKEVLTLSLELSTGDVKKALEQARKDIAPVDPNNLPNTSGTPNPPATPAGRAQVTIEDVPEIRAGYLYYPIANIADIAALTVPDFESTETVQRQVFRLFRVVSEDAAATPRNIVGIQFGSDIATLNGNLSSAYAGNIGLIKLLGRYYLAVTR